MVSAGEIGLDAVIVGIQEHAPVYRQIACGVVDCERVAVAVQDAVERARADVSDAGDIERDVLGQYADFVRIGRAVVCARSEERLQFGLVRDWRDRCARLVPLVADRLLAVVVFGVEHLIDRADFDVGGNLRVDRRERRLRLARRDCRRGGVARQHDAEDYRRYQSQGDHRRGCFLITVFHNSLLKRSRSIERNRCSRSTTAILPSRTRCLRRP